MNLKNLHLLKRIRPGLLLVGLALVLCGCPAKHDPDHTPPGKKVDDALQQGKDSVKDAERSVKDETRKIGG